MIRAPPARRHDDVKADAALRGELERIRQQIFEHLLQALAVGADAAPEIRIHMSFERQLPVFRFVPEWPRHHVDEVGEEHLLSVHGDSAGFDLGQVEDIADQIKQVGAGAMDRAGKLDLLRAQIAFRVVGKLLTQDQDGIERRAQLVRHVGEEFGLVL